MVEFGCIGEWWCLLLLVLLFEVIVVVEVEVVGVCDVIVIGSLFGGYYVIWFVEKYGWKVVLLNLVIVLQCDFKQYLGEQLLWYGGGMIVVECWYLYEFDVLCVLVIMCVDCYYLFVVIGDEVFDY